MIILKFSLFYKIKNIYIYIYTKSYWYISTLRNFELNKCVAFSNLLNILDFYLNIIKSSLTIKLSYKFMKNQVIKK